MVFDTLRTDRYIDDKEFDLIFPPRIKTLSERHWTPIIVAKIASTFLCHQAGLRILDIGSGVGKFCLVGATLQPTCTFFGLDIREYFIKIANKLKKKHAILNAVFECRDMMETDISTYDGIYFYNSFQEKIDDTSVMDDTSSISHEMYNTYSQHLYQKFLEMPVGTRLVTYHTSEFFVPENYKMVEHHLMGKVKCYVKTKSKKASPIIDDDMIKNHILIYGS